MTPNMVALRRILGTCARNPTTWAGDTQYVRGRHWVHARGRHPNHCASDPATLLKSQSLSKSCLGLPKPSQTTPTHPPHFIHHSSFRQRTFFALAIAQSDFLTEVTIPGPLLHEEFLGPPVFYYCYSSYSSYYSSKATKKRPLAPFISCTSNSLRKINTPKK